MSLDRLWKNLFWVASRTGLFVYSRLPVFGRLKAAVGVIKNHNAFLVIERNDGRGISFPGGLALPWETAEQALVREVAEETGLRVTKCLMKQCYNAGAGIPVSLSVFEVEAEGRLRGSWEGMPCWVHLSELRQRVIPSQQPILETLS